MTLSEIAARLDTASLNRDGLPTKALVVANFAEEAFCGVAVLRADFPTRSPGLPVRVFAPDGRPVPCRVVRETLGSPDKNGRRQWTFDLEFFCDLPARTAQAYGAVFADGVMENVEEDGWRERLARGEPLSAVETECRVGNLPNPCPLTL